jgi:hypothetical protein
MASSWSVDGFRGKSNETRSSTERWKQSSARKISWTCGLLLGTNIQNYMADSSIIFCSSWRYTSVSVGFQIQLKWRARKGIHCIWKLPTAQDIRHRVACSYPGARFQAISSFSMMWTIIIVTIIIIIKIINYIIRCIRWHAVHKII